MARKTLALAAVCWAACGLPPLRQSEGAQFAEAPCAFEVPKNVAVTCGYLTVPEKRSDPRSREIRLHIAIYRSRSTAPLPDPVVWIVGGPGGRANYLASKLFDRVVAPHLWNRDFIVMDVRGTGYSQPALDCPEQNGSPGRWMPACRERLAKSADLGAYHSAATAADLDDLRRALRIAEWNVLGESYGTRIALTALRDRPEGIRSAVLDSVAPPEADQYADAPANFESAIDRLARGCAEDPGCGRAFPNVKARLIAVADELDRAPRRLEGEWRGMRVDTQFDGRTLLQALHAALYESDLIPALPKAIDGAASGREDAVWIRALATEGLIQLRLVDMGAHYAVHCAEEIPFTDRTRARWESERRPWLRGLQDTRGILDACRLWRPGPADAREALPVVSAVPTLLMAGEYDPVTPPAYAKSAASHLSKGRLVVFRGMGHWLSANPVNGCAQAMIRAFIDDPQKPPPEDCARQYQPRWVVR